MLLTLLLCLPALALAQQAETGSTPPPPCSDPAYRQFDFWIGAWNVTANDRTPNADGSVRQLWETSRDGQTWSVLFDGLYTRAAADE
jgi:hypothetical protein